MLIAIALLIFVPMVAEARRAAANERTQRRRGGLEPADDIYKVMRLAYPGGFAAMLAEAAIRGLPSARVIAGGAALFLAAKGLKGWVIAALGRAWTFRVIVVPGAPLVVSGPYRFLRHPNYWAVTGEFLGAALMTGATLTGPAAALLFGVLLTKRIVVEERAIAAGSRADRTSSRL